MMASYGVYCAVCLAGMCQHEPCRDGVLADTTVAGTACCGDCAGPLLDLAGQAGDDMHSRYSDTWPEPPQAQPVCPECRADIREVDCRMAGDPVVVCMKGHRHTRSAWVAQANALATSAPSAPPQPWSEPVDPHIQLHEGHQPYEPCVPTCPAYTHPVPVVVHEHSPSDHCPPQCPGYGHGGAWHARYHQEDDDANAQ